MQKTTKAKVTNQCQPSALGRTQSHCSRLGHSHGTRECASGNLLDNREVRVIKNPSLKPEARRLKENEESETNWTASIAENILTISIHQNFIALTIVTSDIFTGHCATATVLKIHIPQCI